MEWEIIHSGAMAPEKIMAKDASLLQELEAHPRPILHLYDWEGDCLTYGYFCRPGELLDLELLGGLGIRTARRPTGGGVIFHLTDWAFSILIPASHSGFSTTTLDNYAYINRRVAKVISLASSNALIPRLWMPTDCCSKNIPTFCMAQPTQYDLIVNGRKIGGAAQRRTKWGYLHQGSISLIPFTNLPLLASIRNLEAQKAVGQAASLLNEIGSTSQLPPLRKKLAELLSDQLSNL